MSVPYGNHFLIYAIHFYIGGMDEPTLEQMKAISEEDEALDFEKGTFIKRK